MNALENLTAAIIRAAEECPNSEVLFVLTGAFVGFAEALVRREGGDETREIVINGRESRDITIHVEK